MAHQNALFLQLPVQFAAVFLLCRGEQEVGAAVQHRKSPGFQLLFCPCAGVHDGGTGLFKINGIFQRGLPCFQGQAVDVIGVQAELDPVQVRDEAGAAHGKAQPRTGQLAGFREGLHHQQVVVPVNERHAALAAKVHIGLIHNDHIVRVRFQDALDGTAGQGQTGGGVGVGDDDGLVQAVVIGGVKGEILLQRNDMAGDMHQPAPDAVTAVGDVGIGQRVGLIAEGPQGKEEVLVTAVAGHDLIRLQAKVRRRRFQQVGAGGVGVETELFHLMLAHRRHHRRAGQIGAFVGVQLDVLLVLRLLPRGVGGDCFKFRREIFTHSNFLTVSVLTLSGASRQLPQRGSLWRFSVALREIAKASPFGRGGIAKQ